MIEKNKKNILQHILRTYFTRIRYFSAPGHIHETDFEGGVGLGDRDASHVTAVGQSGRRGPPEVPVDHTRVPERES